MGILELLILSLGLSMDAFAVAICKGLGMREINYRKAVLIAFSFGFFQALMPLIGYILGKGAETYITPIDHWIIFIILGGIGMKMIYEAIQREREANCGIIKEQNESFSIKELMILSVATSIDALAAGITFAFLNVNIWKIIVFIGVTTFICSVFGVMIGNKFGSKFQSKAEIAGGLALIGIGIKILLEHLGIILI